ncbi:MAG: type II secretion system GspH family protein [Tenericutes bacterium]|nr:type II secretion system GspH family protein [Mycoplasmatota bacterium]
MKEKGFTLIELLAVIVILSVITLITVPMITNVIEESKKKALASSVEGLVESANLYAIENDGVYEFLFDKKHKGSTLKGESLDYRGNIDGEGKLYLDREGNVSVCISNDTYYVYKNYNSGIIVGDKKTGNCIIGFDALTNKYVAMLDNGTGNVSNVYSKDEVNNLVDAKATELDTKITNNTNEITNMKSNIEELQNNLNNYALQSELEKTNTNVENLSSLVNTNQKNIDSINNKLLSKKIVVLKNISKLPADKESWNLSDSYANYDQIIVSYKNGETGVMSNALLFPNLTENYTLWLSSIPNVYDQCGYLIFNGNTVTYYKFCNNNPYIKAIYGQKF